MIANAINAYTIIAIIDVISRIMPPPAGLGVKPAKGARNSAVKL